MSNVSLMHEYLLTRWEAQQRQEKIALLYPPERPEKKRWQMQLQVKIGNGLISLGENLKSHVEPSI